MKQFEKNYEVKKFSHHYFAKPKKSKNQSKGQLQWQEKDLLKQITDSTLLTVPLFCAHFGLSKKECESPDVEKIFKRAFIQLHNERRYHKEYLAVFYESLDRWFKPEKIMPGVPHYLQHTIMMGTYVFVRNNLLVDSEKPEENFSALIEQKLKNFVTRACLNQDIKTKENYEYIFQHYVKNPSERVFEFISIVSEVQFMIHTDLFPSIEPIIYSKGERLTAIQPEIKRRFFHVAYSQKYKSYYDLCLQPQECQVVNNIYFINEKMKVFRINCDDEIELQLQLMKQSDYNLNHFVSQQLDVDKFTKVIENIRKQRQRQRVTQKQAIPQQNVFQQRFAQHKEEVNQMEYNLMKEQIDNSRTPYCSKYSFYQLSQMTQKEIIKRLASHYNISLKQFSDPCYLVGLLMLSFQYINKKQNTSTFDSTQSCLMGFSIQINQLESIGVVYGSILGYQIVNQIQLPKYFAYILKDMLGHQAIVDKNNPLRVFICPLCLCFDRYHLHDYDCQNE